MTNDISNETSLTSGATVVLKSGSPILIVKRTFNDKTTCNWFDGSQLREANFHPKQLKIVTIGKPNV